MLNHTANAEAKEADATLTLDRATLNKIILKEETLKQAEEKGKLKSAVTGLNSMKCWAIWTSLTSGLTS